jgi:hypothetical protein
MDTGNSPWNLYFAIDTDNSWDWVVSDSKARGHRGGQILSVHPTPNEIGAGVDKIEEIRNKICQIRGELEDLEKIFHSEKNMRDIQALMTFALIALYGEMNQLYDRRESKRNCLENHTQYIWNRGLSPKEDCMSDWARDKAGIVDDRTFGKDHKRGVK